MSEKENKKTVTYNAVTIEPKSYLGASIEEVLERKKQMLAKFRSGK
jgi:hypothetical protein